MELAVWDIHIFPSGQILTNTASSRNTLREFKCLFSMYVQGFQLWVTYVMYVKHFSTWKIF